MTFTRVEGEEVRAWWERSCLEWCYAKFEDGKFGDQKYLEKFPELFSQKVHVAEQLAAFMAPWNATRFPLEGATLWHFHGLRIINLFGFKRIYCGDYFLPDTVLRGVYRSYVQDFIFALEMLRAYGIQIPIQSSFSWKEKIKYLLSKYFFQKDQFFTKNLFSI